MVKIKPSKGLQWKPLSMNARVLSQNLDLDGLIGVEELTDYSLNKSNNAVIIGAPSEKIKRGKLLKESKKMSRKKNKLKKIKVKAEALPKFTVECVDDEMETLGQETKVEESVSTPKRKMKRRNKFKDKEPVEMLGEPKSNDIIVAKKVKVNKKIKGKKTKVTYMNSSLSGPTKTKSDENYEVMENGANEKLSDVALNEMTEWLKLNIPENIVRALFERGFKTPTKIQSLVLPSALLARKNIVGAAETGSGKTLAFGIPILTGILNQLNNPTENEDDESDFEEEMEEENEISENKFTHKKRNKLYALILTPTRELAIQVQNHIIDAGKYTSLKIACVVGGMSTEKQLRILNKCPHILVATPGRLWEFIQLGHFHLTSLNKLNYLVIDETDRMIESGHFPELKNILDRITINEDKDKVRQTFVFSATLTHSMKNSMKGKNKFKKKSPKDPSMKKLQDLLKMSHPKVVDITEKIGLTKTLTESKIFCKYDEKDNYLYYFMLQHPGRTLVFCNSISTVKRITLLLTMLNCTPLPLHASMNQRQRLKNLDKFRENPRSVLLATDVAARGLDIPNIEHVIHYHVPRSSDIYIHRSGRTARANKEGLTVVLVDNEELPLYIKNFNSLDKKIDLPDFPIDEMFLSMVKNRVEVAKSIEFLENKVKKNKPDSWIEKAAIDMDIIIDDENLVQSKQSSRENSVMSKALNAKRKELQTLLKKNVHSVQSSDLVKSALTAVKDSIIVTKEEKKLALKKRNKFKRKNKKNKLVPT